MIIPIITAAITISPMIIVFVNGNKKTMAAEIALSAAMITIITIGTVELITADNTSIEIFIRYDCLLTIASFFYSSSS